MLVHTHRNHRDRRSTLLIFCNVPVLELRPVTLEQCGCSPKPSNDCGVRSMTCMQETSHVKLAKGHLKVANETHVGMLALWGSVSSAITTADTDPTGITYRLAAEKG
eukprot:6027146-Amphidinium_carterae.2